MYTAKIIGKEIVRGMLRVQVEFKSDHETFIEYFETNQAQPPTWITEQIRQKLAHINKIPEMHESITTPSEEMTLTDEEIATGAGQLTPRQEYAANLAKFEKYISAIAKRITKDDSESFMELRQKLVDDFKDEYIDLF